MTIRKMILQDYDGVYALWMSCKNMGFNDVDDSRAGIEKFLRRNPDTSFVAEENGAIIGVILGGQDGRRGYIYHLSVAEGHRRQGVGALLTDRCLKGHAGRRHRQGGALGIQAQRGRERLLGKPGLFRAGGRSLPQPGADPSHTGRYLTRST